MGRAGAAAAAGVGQETLRELFSLGGWDWSVGLG